MSAPATPDYAAIDARAYGPMSIDGPDVAERVYRAAVHESRAFLGRGLTRSEVACVLHALADYTLQQRMVGPAVADLAIRPLAFDPEPDYPDQAHGLGRFFHGLGNRIKNAETVEEA